MKIEIAAEKKVKKNSKHCNNIIFDILSTWKHMP